MQMHNMAFFFYSMSVNNIGVYTSCTIWYKLDTPPAVPLKFETAMIQMSKLDECSYRVQFQRHVELFHALRLQDAVIMQHFILFFIAK